MNIPYLTHIFIAFILPIADEPEVEINKVVEPCVEFGIHRSSVYILDIGTKLLFDILFTLLVPVAPTNGDGKFELMIGTALTVAEIEVDREDQFEKIGTGTFGATHVRFQDVDDEDVGGDRGEGVYVTFDVLISGCGAFSAFGPFAT